MSAFLEFLAGFASYAFLTGIFMALHRFRCRYSASDRWGQNWKGRHQSCLDQDNIMAGIFWPVYLVYLTATEPVLLPLRITNWVRRAKLRKELAPCTLPENYMLTSKDYRMLKPMIQAFEEKLPVEERE